MSASRTEWCDDWGCPAKASCALHFGRSADYAAMRLGSKLRRRARSADAEACGEYRRDRAKRWLLSLVDQARIV